MIEEQQNNPLHGLKLEVLLTELVEFYGWDILAASMRFHCFTTNPSIKGSLPFLRKTEWARAKLEEFYLYRFKRMPRANDKQYQLAPRERGFANGIVPLAPMILTVESIELSQAKAASAFKARSPQRERSHSSRKFEGRSQGKPSKKEPVYDPSDPWGQKNK